MRDIVFGNAMLRRELSHLWRWPATSRRQDGWMCLLVALFCFMTVFVVMAIFHSPGSARDAWWMILAAYGIVGAILCAVRPATSIAHEREGGAWQSLSLTLLSPLQIAQAKVVGPITGAAGYGVGAWILLLLAAYRGQMSLSVVLPSVLLVIAIWAQVAIWGVLVGTRARQPASALGWGLGGPILAWGGIPLLMSLFKLGPLEGSSVGFLALLHPLAALDMGGPRGESRLLALALHVALAAMLFALARRAVQRSHRTRDAKASRIS